MKNISTTNLWAKILKDMTFEDIVLEIKIQNIDLTIWQKTLDYLKLNYINNIINKEIFDKINIEKELNNFEETLTLEFNINNLELFLSFYDIYNIEFFTGSVINLTKDQIISLFQFIKNISIYLELNVELFCEGVDIASCYYDYKEEKFII